MSEREDYYAEAAAATHADFYAAKERKKLEQLKKAVVDTKAAYAAWGATDAAWGATDAWDAAAALAAAWDAWVKAKLELDEYLKEQDK
jgi:hypothetical protein